jgi:ApaG protein
MDINTKVTVKYLHDRSSPERSVFAYVYFVEIINNSDKTIQLINRHWKVFSAGKQIADVKGEGVVGEQPIIPPNKYFSYNSWTVISDTSGYMQGTFTFKDQANQFFDIEVPRFELIHFPEDVIH